MFDYCLMINEEFELLSNHRDGYIGQHRDVFNKAGEHVREAKCERGRRYYIKWNKNLVTGFADK